MKASIEATKAAADAVKAGMTAQKDALAPIAITYFPMSAPRVERRVSTIPVNGKPNLRIKAPGCSVRVTGNDSSEVKYTVTQIARSRQDDTIDVKENKSGNDIEIVIDAGNTSSRSVARIDVTVPKRSDLSIITDGEIRVTGVTGTLDLKGEDGAVSVIDTEGSLKVSAADGMIRLVGVKGSASVSTEDGPISLDGRFESLDARSGDGSIPYAANRPERRHHRRAEISSSSDWNPSYPAARRPDDTGSGPEDRHIGSQLKAALPCGPSIPANDEYAKARSRPGQTLNSICKIFAVRGKRETLGVVLRLDVCPFCGSSSSITRPLILYRCLHLAGPIYIRSLWHSA